MSFAIPRSWFLENIKELSKKEKYSLFFTYALIIFYKITLDVSFYIFVPNVWYLDNFTLDFNVCKYIESYFLLIATFVFLPRNTEKISNVATLLMFLMSYIPALTVYSLTNQPRLFTYGIAIFWVVFFICINKIKMVDIPTIKINSKKHLYVIFFIFTLTTLFYIFNFFGLHLNFDISRVYEIRQLYKKHDIALATYIFNWTAYIIFPVFFTFFIIERKWVLLAYAIIVQFLVFSITGMKSFIFSIVFIFCFLLILKHKNFINRLISLFIFGVLLGIFSYYIFGDVWISSLFTRRTLLKPAHISYMYYDFFSKNSFTYFSQHHIFNKIISYPYTYEPPRLIGKVYFNNNNCNANNGLYGDAFMNLGFCGLIIWPFLISIIFLLIDKIFQNKEKKIGIIAVIMPVFTLINSSLLTCLVTHGILVLLLILYLFPEKIKKET
ncbi:MAG: hypothetical protein N3A01_01675 [Bacteroidales bacterium]|nr:hypothetical protein [Bacteroidales bacterium]